MRVIYHDAGMLNIKKEMKKGKLCASCMFFHKGIHVDHSHCDLVQSPRYPEGIRHSGRIFACSYYQKRKRKGHDTP